MAVGDRPKDGRKMIFCGNAGLLEPIVETGDRGSVDFLFGQGKSIVP
jgi:hypothetical protein